MKKQSIDKSKEGIQRDTDLAGAEVAMKRAARKARERARQVGAGVFVLKNGQIVEEKPDGMPEQAKGSNLYP